MTTSEVRKINDAADYLQKLLDAHTTGRWTAVRRYRKGTTVLANIDFHRPPLPGSNIPDFKMVSPARETEVQYRIATQPETVRALVNLLRAAATLARFTVSGETHPIVQPAVAIADSVLEGSW